MLFEQILFEQMLYLQESLQANKILNIKTKPTISKNIITKVVQTKVRTFEQNITFKKHYNKRCSNKGSNIRTKRRFQKQ